MINVTTGIRAEEVRLQGQHVSCSIDVTRSICVSFELD